MTFRIQHNAASFIRAAAVICQYAITAGRRTAAVQADPHGNDGLQSLSGGISRNLSCMDHKNKGFQEVSMALRINFVQHGDDRWYCDAELIGDHDISLGLYTGPGGHGLLMEDEKGLVRILLDEATFWIPAAAGKKQAAAEFAAGLVSLGWGPEIDHHGLVIQRQKREMT